jgi:hypothetical protein
MRFASLCAGALLALAACGAPGTGGVPPGGSFSSAASSSPALNVTYANDLDRYRIDHPSSWTRKEGDTLITVDDEYPGTAFVPPAETGEGTRLLDARVHVARMDECPSYGNGDMLEIGGRTFIRDSWSGAAAGNLYEGDVYMTDAGPACFVITLYRHLCNLGAACGDERTSPFDDTGLKAEFEMMVGSFALLGGV